MTTPCGCGQTKREAHVIVECRGEDAARFSNAENVHGWQEDVIKAAERGKKREDTFSISFECEVLKSDKDSEEHIRRFLPSLNGLGAVVNIGTMIIKGLDFDSQSREMNGEDMSQFSGRLLESSSEFSRSVISEIDHVVSSSIGRENVGTGRASLKSVSPFNTLRSYVFGESRTFPPDDELHKLVEEELEIEGLTSEPLEFLWEEDASGWRTKRGCVNGGSVSVDSSNPTDPLNEEYL
ncbi:hypothetical protein O6H91_23G056600 [Diphasiastrum complanatum]|uniref:Uncharacterized protein n=1 Tax=Diphasiastrum complanatum TaxID=34168 RepID=A0ACC2AAW9_DIPCM|nr:hypothetical protein O6H91_23G056600 [Diphasiastrum complanatum]